MNRTDRLYALVEELRAVSPAYRTAGWLAERFEVSVRTVERDLSALQQAGVPIYATPGRRGGYALDSTHTLPPVNLTAAEVTAVAVALSSSNSTPFASAGRSALLKMLAAMATDDATGARALAERVRIIETEGAVEPPTGATRLVIEQAMIERRVTQILYSDKGGVASERVVEPVQVLGLAPHWYLVAWCRLREDHRAFRLDRVLQARLTDEVAPDRGPAPPGPPGFVARAPVFD